LLRASTVLAYGTRALATEVELAMKKIPLLAALATALLGSCIGPNRAFRSLNSWNTRATDSKWWNEAIHVALWVVPVYELALAGDIVIFNSVEFWGGNNPIKEPEAPKPVNAK
jgi:hypothetical protein